MKLTMNGWKLGMQMLPIACCISILILTGDGFAEDARQRRQSLQRLDAVIRAPRVGHSLEWAIDSSDAIVTAMVPRTGRDVTLKSVLKPVGKMDVNWPPGDKERFHEILKLYRPGDEIMFCLRFDKSSNSSRVYHYFPLISLKDPRRSQEPGAFNRNFPPELDSTTRMYACRRIVHAGFRHLTVDKNGKVIKDPDKLLTRVKQRIAAGSRVPPDCDREAVEQGKSVYGGFYEYRHLASHLSSAEFPTILVPPEPEYRKNYFRPGGNSVTWHLANYRDDEVVSWLKVMLDDRMVSEHGTRVTTGATMRWTRYKLAKGQHPPKIDGEDEGTIKVVRTFFNRKRAYEILTRMGIKVERPLLTPH